jgi:hypothetical protein
MEIFKKVDLEKSISFFFNNPAIVSHLTIFDQKNVKAKIATAGHRDRLTEEGNIIHDVVHSGFHEDLPL